MKNADEKKEGALLRFLYGNFFGRVLLKVLCRRWISVTAGAFLSTPLSRPLIEPFVKKNGIDLSDYEGAPYETFNDFFSRKIKEGKRPISGDVRDVASPCDGKLSAFRISRDTVIPVKQSEYRIGDLLGNKALAEKYRDGVCLVFRLCVDDYHRYSFPVDGRVVEKRKIKGELHTVRPIALESVPVFARNSREYCLIETDGFGDVIQMEVGALLVGRIENRDTDVAVKGEEKGTFLFGGSTVILLFEKDRVLIEERYFERTALGLETPVKSGETVGKRIA